MRERNDDGGGASRATGPAAEAAAGGLPPHPLRRVRGRRLLPTGRALLGSVLIATAAAGVLVAHRQATASPTTRYLVVTDDVEAGSPVRREDLGSVAAELPDGLSAVRADAAESVVGRVARQPLRRMDLLRDGDLFEGARFTPGASTEVSLELPAAAALAGTLRVGDRVSVLSTDPDSAGTSTIARDVLVTSVGDEGDGAIGASGTVRIRLGARDEAAAEALVDAVVRTQVRLALPTPTGGVGR